MTFSQLEDEVARVSDEADLEEPLLVRNAELLVTMDAQRRELTNAGIFIRDGFIEHVGPTNGLPKTADTVLDLRGQNINLFPWLRAHYRLWAARTPASARTATIVGLGELALSGCTTAFDHAYLFQNGCRVDDQIHAAAELGLRFVVSRGSMSLGESKGGLPPDDCVEDERVILEDSQRVIERYHDPKPGSMLQIVLAPCSPF